MSQISGQMPKARRSESGQMPPGRLVDLSRYPITDLAGEAGRSLVERCRRRLARDGACVLEDFLQPQVAEAAWPEVMP